LRVENNPFVKLLIHVMDERIEHMFGLKRADHALTALQLSEKHMEGKKNLLMTKFVSSQPDGRVGGFGQYFMEEEGIPGIAGLQSLVLPNCQDIPAQTNGVKPVARDATVTHSDLELRALKTYKPPFRMRHGYIYDAEGNMVLDDHCDEAPDALLRIRGWGRLCREKDAEALQDAIGDLIAKALTEYWERHKP